MLVLRPKLNRMLEEFLISGSHIFSFTMFSGSCLGSSSYDFNTSTFAH